MRKLYATYTTRELEINKVDEKYPGNPVSNVKWLEKRNTFRADQRFCNTLFAISCLRGGC